MNKACGYCVGYRNSRVKSSSHLLIPVIFTSGGKRKKSSAHLECIKHWQKTSQVEIDTETELGRAAVQELALRRQKARKAELAYEERQRQNPKQCSNCGKPIERHSKGHCSTCKNYFMDYSQRGTLTPDEVVAVRTEKGRTGREWSKLLQVSESTISLVLNNKTWRKTRG